MPRLKIAVLAVSCSVVLGGCMTAPTPGTDVRFEASSMVENGGLAATARDFNRMGREFSLQGRYEIAIAAYMEALLRDAQLADAHNGLGVTYAKLGRYDDAIRSIQAAIAVAPNAGYLYNNLGYTYLLRESFEQAEQAFAEALRLDPGHRGAMINLQDTRERIGRRGARPAAKQVADEGVVVIPLPARDADEPPIQKSLPQDNDRAATEEV